MSFEKLIERIGCPMLTRGETGERRHRGPSAGSVSFLCLCIGVTVCPSKAFSQEAGTDVAPSSVTTAQRAPNSIGDRIPTPTGYTRVIVPAGSFAEWLRNRPLKLGKPDVFLFDGTRNPTQDTHFAVLDIDVGSKDLQQCADAVIRLRAEYLWSAGKKDEIAFKFTSGDLIKWNDWRNGRRPVVGRGHPVHWTDTGASDDSYDNFRQYLDMVFSYAGTASLNRDLTKVEDPTKIEAGQVFVQPKTNDMAGHAVIVVDVAENASLERIFLLAQSYMPAQDIHILVNLSRRDRELNPWYRAQSQGELATPEWLFSFQDLKRF